MFSSPLARKIVRVGLSSAAAGTALAIVFLGGSAEAAVPFGRGF